MTPEQFKDLCILLALLGFFLLLGFLQWLRRQPPKCQHLWEMLQKVNMFHESNGSETPNQIKQLMRCKHCGEIKTVKLV